MERVRELPPDARLYPYSPPDPHSKRGLRFGTLWVIIPSLVIWPIWFYWLPSPLYFLVVLAVELILVALFIRRFVRSADFATSSDTLYIKVWGHWRALDRNQLQWNELKRTEASFPVERMYAWLVLKERPEETVFVVPVANLSITSVFSTTYSPQGFYGAIIIAEGHSRYRELLEWIET